jgi:hypothetical protein
MAKEEQIGFHKGSITTLLKEREELVRMVNIIDKLLGAHASALKELGVDLGQKQSKKSESIEDLLKGD